MTAVEFNFDGLVGPTHHYAGLSFGNRASMRSGGTVSNPKAAALEGLNKMRLLHNLGAAQGIIPPQERPSIPDLRRLGFVGSDAAVLAKAYKEAPEMLMRCSSASSMWTANAATISPSTDTEDKKIHCTPANLNSHLHRSIEHRQTAIILRTIFNGSCFVHHPPLSPDDGLYDEGAANHLRLCHSHGEAGIEVFAYGKSTTGHDGQTHYPARQTLEASQSVARNHQLIPGGVLFAKQNPIAIDAGVFHNDVIAVSNENVLLVHETAFADQNTVIETLKSKYRQVSRGDELIVIQVTTKQIPIDLAVKSYVFNSQVVTLPDSTMAIICPEDCCHYEDVKVFLTDLQSQENGISQLHYVPLGQSMKNGGGPACLRLRVVLTADEQQTLHPGVILSEHRFAELESWVRTHYRDALTLDDFADPKFLDQTRRALDELTQLLHLGSIYPFQQNSIDHKRLG